MLVSMKDIKSSHEMRGAEETYIENAEIKSCENLEGLDQIQTPGTDLVIWHRTLPIQFQNWIESLSSLNLPQIRILLAPADLKSALDPILDNYGLPNNDMRDLMVDDISVLVQAFALVAQTEKVDVRLEHIDHDSCWRFHTDIVELRLLTTYLGVGTEWVHPTHSENAIEHQRQYSGPLERLAPNEVAIFKGKKASKTNGIVHRSPPIRHTGNSRLLLCLNKETEVSPPTWSRE